MVSVFLIVKTYEIELKATCADISNSAQAKWAGRYMHMQTKNPVPLKVAKSAKPGRSKTAHRIEDERLYKSLQKNVVNVTEDQVTRTERQHTKWGQFKACK